jgi:hypothetical protein
MAPLYERTQKGTVILVALGLSAAFMLVVLLAVPAESGERTARWVLAGTLALLLGVGIAFGSLTVRVGDGVLAWRFGPGLIRKSVPLDRVRHVEAVRTSALYGWGIRWTPRGWLYNVSGLGAVEVRLEGGKRFLLGTDHPEELVAAIHAAQRTKAA